VTSNGSTYWTPDLRLHLLGELTVAGNAAAELLDTHRFTGVYPGGLVIDGDRLFVSASPQTFYGVGDYAPPPSAGPAVRAQTETPTDRLQIFDLSQHTLRTVYDQPTGSFGLQLMGTYQGRLFVNLQGDGVLVVDVDNPAKPRASASSAPSATPRTSSSPATTPTSRRAISASTTSTSTARPRFLRTDPVGPRPSGAW
jgi:hypothetical protein